MALNKKQLDKLNLALNLAVYDGQICRLDAKSILAEVEGKKVRHVRHKDAMADTIVLFCDVSLEQADRELKRKVTFYNDEDMLFGREVSNECPECGL